MIKHPDRFDCPHALIDYNPFREYGLIVHDGGTAVAVIDYCPWCGAARAGPADSSVSGANLASASAIPGQARIQGILLNPAPATIKALLSGLFVCRLDASGRFYPLCVVFPGA